MSDRSLPSASRSSTEPAGPSVVNPRTTTEASTTSERHVRAESSSRAEAEREPVGEPLLPAAPALRELV